jgi:hypothetical protein
MLAWFRRRFTPDDPDDLVASSGVSEAREAREAIESTTAAFQREAAAEITRQHSTQRVIAEEFIIGDLFPRSCRIRRENAS